MKIKVDIKNNFDFPKNCWKGIATIFLESILAGSYYFFSIYFVDILHINVYTTGMIISCYGLGTILGGLIGGKLSDKFAPSLVAAISLCIQAIAFLMLTKIKIISLIGIDLLILGIATYGFITANYVWVLSYCHTSETERLKVINTLVAASNLGLGLSAIIIAELSTYSFEAIFLFCGIMLLSLSPCLIFQKQNKNINKNINFSSTASTPLSKLATPNKEKPFNIVNLALACLFFTGVIVSQLGTTYAIFLKEKFPLLGIHAFSMLFALSTALIVILQNYLVNKLSKCNKLMMIGLGSFLIGFGMLMLNFSFVFPLAVFGCIIYSFGEMLFFSFTQLFCYQQGDENKKGKSLGQYRMVYASSRFIGPTIGGAIYHYLSGRILWYVCGCIGFIVLIICYQFKERGENLPSKSLT